MKLKFKEVKQEGIKLDLGTGKGANKPEGFIGVDLVKGPGVDKIADLRKPWPWKSGSVDEINAQYILQYLKPEERKHFVNEAHRVLKTGGKMVVVVPHWCASKAYGDLDAYYPPVAEAWFMMTNKAFREAQNFVIKGYTCDFDYTLGYMLHPSIQTRHIEYQQTAITWWKESAQDIACTMIKR